MLEATTKAVPDSARRPHALVAGWGAVGVTLALVGALGHAPPLAPLFVLGSVALWTALYRREPAVRAWADALPLRALVAAHAIRLPIGIAFLLDARAPELFATRAGYGDIAIGALAIVVAALAAERRRVVFAFSLLGLADILVALGTAMYLLFRVHDVRMIEAITTLPYPLLPLLIVPAVIVTHLLVLARVRPR